MNNKLLIFNKRIKKTVSIGQPIEMFCKPFREPLAKMHHFCKRSLKTATCKNGGGSLKKTTWNIIFLHTVLLVGPTSVRIGGGFRLALHGKIKGRL
jgi:hypothetical protein